MGESIMDILTEKNQQDQESEIFVPKKCAECDTAVVCNILPILVNIGRLGIESTINKCPFCAETKK